MAREGIAAPEFSIYSLICSKTADPEFLIHSLIGSNKLAYLQLITILVYGNSPPISHEKGYLNQNFRKNLEKYV